MCVAVAMSIRTSHAAQEASRFSLRDALMGNMLHPDELHGQRTLTPRVSAALQTVPRPFVSTGVNGKHPTPRAPTGAFTFANIFSDATSPMATTGGDAAIVPHANPSMTYAGQVAIERIERMQQSHPSNTLATHPKQTTSASASELLCLRNVAHSLDQKVQTLSQKLKHTEASLVKANTQILSEREAVRVQNMTTHQHIRQLKESDATSMNAAAQATKDKKMWEDRATALEVKVHASEDTLRDRNMHIDAITRDSEALAERLRAMESERDAASILVTEYKSKCDELVVKVDAVTHAKRELEAHTDPALHTIKKGRPDSNRDVDRVTEQLEAERVHWQATIDEQRVALEKLRADNNALLIERDDARALIESAFAERDSVSSRVYGLSAELSKCEQERDDARTLLATAQKALRESNDTTVDVSAIARDLAHTQDALRESEHARMAMITRITILENEMGSTTTGYFKLGVANDLIAKMSATYPSAPPTKYRPSSRMPVTAPLDKTIRTVRFERKTGKSNTGVGVCSVFKDCNRNTCFMGDLQGVSLNGHAHGRVGPNMLAGQDIGNTKSGINTNESIEILVAAVSKDVVSSIVNSRRAYMLASGIGESEAEEELRPFAVAPIGEDGARD